MVAKTLKGTILIATLLGVSLPVRGDDTDHLPDGTTSVIAIDFAAFFKSKVFLELKKQAPELAKEIETGSGGADTVLALPLSSMTRITLAPPHFAVITTVKPVTAATIKSSEQLSKDFEYEEVKVGKFTTYMDKKRFDEPGKGSLGKSFCVTADRTILATIVPEYLRKVLERKDKKPELSAEFRKALEKVGTANTIAAVVDFQKSQEGELLSEIIRRDEGKTFPGLSDVAGKIRTMTLTINVTDNIKASMRIACQDAASATELKKSLTAGLGNIKKELTNGDGLSDAENMLRKRALATLDAVKLSADGTSVEAQLTLDTATSVEMVRTFLPQKKVPVKEPPKEK